MSHNPRSIKDIHGYPSDDVPNEVKATKEYGLQYFKAMYHEYNSSGSRIGNLGVSRYKEAQNYRQGKQDNRKYMTHFEHLKSMFGPNKSLLNLDYKVVSPIPEIVDVIVGSLERRGINIKCQATDPEANNDRMAEKLTIKETMNLIQSGFIQSLRGHIGAPMPDLGNAMMAGAKGLPKDDQELEARMEYLWKAPYERMAETGVDYVFSLSDYREDFKGVLENLSTLGVAGTSTHMDKRGVIKVESVNMKRAVLDFANSNTFKNMRHAGEIKDLPISKLREMAGDDISEADLKKLAEKQGWSGDNYISNFETTGSQYYTERPYDSYTVPCMYACFYRNNKITYDVKGKPGMRKAVRSKSGYQPQDPEAWEKRKQDLKYRVFYEGWWVVGEDMVFDYKLGENMATKPGTVGDCLLPFNFYAINLVDGDNESLVERLIALADDYMILRLKFLAAIIKSPPPGFAANIDALLQVPLDGEGTYWEVVDLIDLYLGSGILLHGGRGENGDYLGEAVRELRGGLPPDVMQIGGLLREKILEIEQVAGVTREARGSAPERQSATASKLSIMATSNAIQPIISAAEHISKATADRIISLLQLKVQDGTIEQYVNAVGSRNGYMAKITEDIRHHDLGVFCEFEPDDMEWAQIEEKMQKLMDAREAKTGPGITLSDYFFVKRIRNIKTAEMELTRRVDLREKEAKEHELAMIKAQGDNAAQSAEAAAQAELKKEEELLRIKEPYEIRAHKRQMEAIKAQVEGNMRLGRDKSEQDFMRESMEEEERRKTEKMKKDEDFKRQELIEENKRKIEEKKAIENAKKPVAAGNK